MGEIRKTHGTEVVVIFNWRKTLFLLQVWFLIWFRIHNRPQSDISVKALQVIHFIVADLWCLTSASLVVYWRTEHCTPVSIMQQQAKVIAPFLVTKASMVSLKTHIFQFSHQDDVMWYYHTITILTERYLTQQKPCINWSSYLEDPYRPLYFVNTVYFQLLLQ